MAPAVLLRSVPIVRTAQPKSSPKVCGCADAVHVEEAHSAYPLVHLFDEPQFNTQDGYIGFMLDFFRRLRNEGRLVFVCLHPTATFQLDILREICDQFIFLNRGQVRSFSDFRMMTRDPDVTHYLGALAA